MTVRVTSLVLYRLNVPEPINHLFEIKETKDFEFIEYDKTIVDERISTLIEEGKIAVQDIGEGSGFTTGQVTIPGLDTSLAAQYLGVYVSGNNAVSPTDASTATGTDLTATVAGVFDGINGSIVNAGKVEVQFDAALVVSAGEPALLSYTNSGQFTNVPPAGGSGNYQTVAGIILDTSPYVAFQRCFILLQPGPPLKR